MTYLVRCPRPDCQELMISGAKDCGFHEAPKREPKVNAGIPRKYAGKEKSEGILFTPWQRKSKPLSEKERQRLDREQAAAEMKAAQEMRDRLARLPAGAQEIVRRRLMAGAA